MTLPTSFRATQLMAAQEEKTERDYYDAGKTPRDFEALGAYLSAFPFKWHVRVVHDEPIPGTSAHLGGGMGGTPQMRVEGFLEGNGVKFGKFEVAFHGRRIDVILPPERQQLFAKAMAALPAPTEEDERHA